MNKYDGFVFENSAVPEPDSADALASLESKQLKIEDAVEQVARGVLNGYYLWGRGGTGKSFHVQTTLERLGVPYEFFNGKLSEPAFCQLLSDKPAGLFLLEDLLLDSKTYELLKYALWGQRNKRGYEVRRVKPQTMRKSYDFVFEGQIILIMNRPLGGSFSTDALRSRVLCHRLEFTDEEMIALMREVSAEGFQHGSKAFRKWLRAKTEDGNGILSPEECQEVCEYIVERHRESRRGLDMRVLIKSFASRLASNNGIGSLHWKDRVEDHLSEVIQPELKENRAARITRETAIANEIAGLPRALRIAEWKKRTGKSEKAYYRRRDSKD